AGLLAGASTALVVDARRARGPELSFAMAAAVALAIGGLDLTLTSLRSFAGLVQFTDWSGGQRHLVGLGWLGFMAAAVAYWLVPRMAGTRLHAPRAAGAHLYLGVVG